MLDAEKEVYLTTKFLTCRVHDEVVKHVTLLLLNGLCLGKNALRKASKNIKLLPRLCFLKILIYIFQICQVLMLVSTGERAALPYWFHRCVADAGINHRQMYSTAVPLEPSQHEMTCAACLDHEKTITFLATAVMYFVHDAASN